MKKSKKATPPKFFNGGKWEPFKIFETLLTLESRDLNSVDGSSNPEIKSPPSDLIRSTNPWLEKRPKPTLKCPNYHRTTLKIRSCSHLSIALIVDALVGGLGSSFNFKQPTCIYPQVQGATQKSWAPPDSPTDGYTYRCSQVAHNFFFIHLQLPIGLQHHFPFMIFLSISR